MKHSTRYEDLAKRINEVTNVNKLDSLFSASVYAYDFRQITKDEYVALWNLCRERGHHLHD